MPYVPAPVIEKLEGVSLNCVWLYKNSSSTALTCCIKIALAFGGFNFAALTSKVAQ
jgi:hypothetical protein